MKDRKERTIEELNAFLKDKYDVTKISKLGDDTVMEDFMKIFGDDASEFIEDFFEHFDIAAENFDYREHVSPEGLMFILKKFRPKNFRPVKYKHLKRCLETGKWEYFD